MATKSLWIKSTNSWVASKRSINPSGDTSWFELSKSSGAANDPIGEFINVTVTDNMNMNERNGFIDVMSDGKTISVTIRQLSGEETSYNLVNMGFNLVNNGFNLVNAR